MNPNHLLIIGFVWPEPNSSAAGTRILQLIDCFQTLGYTITFASATLKTEHAFDLSTLNVECFEITLNSNSFDDFIKELNPTHVMFDRFLTEEQFGWRVNEHCPKAIRILDTEDLHCLRKTRQECSKRQIEFSMDILKSNEITKRELASLFRSHFSIMISETEIDILVKEFNFPKEKLLYIPFLDESGNTTTLQTYEERQHFMTIGSFRHQPNVDSVLYLKTNIWPLIRKELPEVELHIYGSYPKQQITQLNNLKEGFIVKGWAKDAKTVVENAKVMLAPLRFGAGQKGKFFDAVLCGTPSVTTPIGCEGMLNKEEWSGFIGESDQEIADNAINLYRNQTRWEKEHNKSRDILSRHFSKSKYLGHLQDKLTTISNNKISFYEDMLNYHSFRNSRFMSKWIEEKNK